MPTQPSQRATQSWLAAQLSRVGYNVTCPAGTVLVHRAAGNLLDVRDRLPAGWEADYRGAAQDTIVCTLRLPVMPDMTPNERAVLTAIRDSDYHDGRDPVGDPVWSHDLDVSGVDRRSMGGVVSSLARKGYVTCTGTGSNHDTVTLTEAGAHALNE